MAKLCGRYTRSTELYPIVFKGTSPERPFPVMVDKCIVHRVGTNSVSKSPGIVVVELLLAGQHENQLDRFRLVISAYNPADFT